MGAINRIAYAAEFSRFDAYPFMELVVGADVADWNDAEGRTQAEVVAALRAAAEKARTDSAVGTTEGRAPILSPETNEQTPVTHTGGA
jgi:hypothetical protein